RTYNLQSPFPEEFNRQSTSIIATYHFAPTELAKENLLKEGRENVYVTGNTVIDALTTTVQEDYTHTHLDLNANNRLILLTA
ncbi:UDP-N-acetylglucosamine 2-epimerase, partial [Streptococcus pneumoniae]